MQRFATWLEARERKLRVLDKAPAYSSYNLPKSTDLPYSNADGLLKAFEHGKMVPLPIIADALEDEGHPHAAVFRSPELMAKAHFYMALPKNTNPNWDNPTHDWFKNHLLERYRNLFAGNYQPNYRSQKGQIKHGQYISFFHDLIHNPGRLQPEFP